MSTYDNPTRITYQFLAAAVDTDAIFGRIVGPSGMQGRVSGIEFVCTTACTGGTSSVVGVGTVADPDAYATLTIPATSQYGVINSFTDNTDDDNLMPADTLVTIDSDGGQTAGDGDVYVTVDWF